MKTAVLYHLDKNVGKCKKLPTFLSMKTWIAKNGCLDNNVGRYKNIPTFLSYEDRNYASNSCI